MIKEFLKYLLIICALLLSGYSHLAAQSQGEGDSFTPISSTIGAEIASLCAIQNNQDFIVYSSTSGTTKEHHKKLVTAEYEVEEDDLVAFKKFLESSKFIAAIFYAFTFGFLFRSIGKCLPYFRHHFQLSSYRWHIVIQVFRI